MKKLLIGFLMAFSAVSVNAEVDIKTTSPNVKLIGADGKELEGVASSTSEIKLFEKVLDYAKTLTKSETITAIRNYTFTITVTPEVDTPPVVDVPLTCDTGFEPNGTGDACVAIPDEPDDTGAPETPVETINIADYTLGAIEWGTFTLPSDGRYKVIFGSVAANKWFELLDVAGGETIACSVGGISDSDPSVGFSKACYYIQTDSTEPVNTEESTEPDPNAPDPMPPMVHDDPNSGHMGMPEVDTAFNMASVVGSSTMDIRPTSDFGNGAGRSSGEARFVCQPSHMANDDPIVFPNQSGVSHHHTFFGNTETSANADVSKFHEFGNSTCAGGIANRSAYWVPSMIDTATNKPIKPMRVRVYYKTNRPDLVNKPPVGLRMIVKPHVYGRKTRYTCNDQYGSRTYDSLPNCNIGDSVQYMLSFPNCWDGINLDSPDHTSHMAFGGYSSACPASHPVMIPEVTFNIDYRVDTPIQNWRLASDKTGEASGYSIHGDWVNGWEAGTLEHLLNNCHKKGTDCHAYLIGGGLTTF
jgi:hypothetical protein